MFGDRRKRDFSLFTFDIIEDGLTRKKIEVVWVKTLDAVVIIKLHALFEISFGYVVLAIKNPSDIYPIFIHTQGSGHS